MKSKILLLTTMLASASFAFAQTETTRSGITYEILTGANNEEIIESGEVGRNNPISFTYSQSDGILLQDETHTTYTNQEKRVNVKAIAITDKSKIQPGQISSWRAQIPNPQTILEKDYSTYIEEFAETPEITQNGTYKVDLTHPQYGIYALVCSLAQKAEKFKGKIYKGSGISNWSKKKDERGAWINENLYYYRDYTLVPDPDDEDIVTQVYYYRVIENTTGGVYTTTEYINCFNTYTPTEIADDIQWAVTTIGKVGKVTGIVNNKRIAEAVARGERNFDFTGATILGEVNVDVPANKLAYFSKTTTAAGTNVVVGTGCEKYLITDNGEEIYVNKAFSAEDATYERKFSAGTYGTLVLPFNVSNTGGIIERQARLTDYNATENRIVCTTADMIVSNTPYMIQINSDATELKGDVNTPVYATASAKSGIYNQAQFIGTFEPISGGSSTLANAYVVSTSGTIGKLKSTSTLKPGRCYFNYTGILAEADKAKISNATIEIMDEDGTVIDFIVPNFDGEEATDIDGIITNSNVVSVQYISVNGQVSNEPVKGMNLVKKTYADGTVETSKVAY